MIGDGLVVKQYQWTAAGQVMDAIRERLAADGPIAVTVAGESGSGKSEIAYCLTKLLAYEGKLSVILSQDDYFRLPPKSNTKRRFEDVSWVGPGEVQPDVQRCGEGCWEATYAQAVPLLFGQGSPIKQGTAEKTCLHMQMTAQHEVVDHRHLLEELYILKCAGHAQGGDAVGL